MNTVHSTAVPGGSGVFYRLGAFVARHRWSVLVSYLVLLVIVGVFGVRVFSAMQSEGFNDPGSDSSRAAQILAEEFETRDPVVILAIETPTRPIADAASVEPLLDQVGAIDGVADVVSYWSTGGAEQFLGKNERIAQALVFAEDGADRSTVASLVVDATSGQQGDLTIYAFGGEVVGNAFTEQISGDLLRAEVIAVPVITVLLIFVLGSIVAAGLPFLVAAGTILGSFLLLYLVTLFTDVSIFALNLVTGLGLALGIDYALLIINRFREELRERSSVPESVAVTVATAGKTVFVSGAAVAIALSSLLVFPQYFLRSFAYAGIAVGVLAVIGALLAIPALLAILGTNVNRLKVRRGDLAPKDDGAWARIARFVMRNPWPVLLGTTALLLVMATPALGAVFGQVDERSLPADNPAAQAGELLREQFPGSSGSTLDVVLREPQSTSAIADYAIALSALPNVDRVISPRVIAVQGALVGQNPQQLTWAADDAIRLEVRSAVRPIDPAGVDLVAEVRAVPAPAEEVLVGGLAAVEADATSSVLDRVWIVAVLLALATMVILFLFTGSVLIPIKAIVLNLLGLAATLGALVWTFQGGHLTWLTGEYTPTGTIALPTLALIAVIAFALSMDYEVFMLSRIKEEHDSGKSTPDAVALGLQRTGRIVTAAALLIGIVFVSFLTSGVTQIKQLGFGVAVAILLDATVVRALLVPSFMRIAGRANWWAPSWLRKVHDRVGFRDG